MTTRDEHLAWCKERALVYARAGDRANAIASMVSDLGKWEGGEMYDKQLITLLVQDAMFFRTSASEIEYWIKGFN